MLDRLSDAADAAVPLLLVAPDAWEARLPELAPAERAWLAATGVVGKAGTVAALPGSDGAPARWLAVVAPDDPWAGAAAAAKLPTGTYALADPLDPDAATDFAAAWLLEGWRFDRLRAAPETPPQRPTLVLPAGADRAAAERLAAATILARDLITTPPDALGPEELAEAARAVAARHGAEFRVIAGAALAEGFPMIHAVGKGSARAPRLIDLVWGDPAHPRVTLVGKGVCFDSGGLDLKTSSGMRLMKKDMGGAATMLALADLLMGEGAAIRLRLLIPAVENLPSATAFRASDVLRSRKGLTVEVGNTDAEGRLILADALWEAASEKPALLLDAATLTGAARVALGPELPALFARDDALAAEILAAGVARQDPIWRLPLHPGYRRMLDSPVADLSSTGEGGFAGAILAALFLAEFVPAEIPWAHIDTYAWSAKSRPGRPEGGEPLALRALADVARARAAG